MEDHIYKKCYISSRDKHMKPEEKRVYNALCDGY